MKPNTLVMYMFMVMLGMTIIVMDMDMFMVQELELELVILIRTALVMVTDGEVYNPSFFFSSFFFPKLAVELELDFGHWITFFSAADGWKFLSICTRCLEEICCAESLKLRCCNPIFIPK